ncbi:hypothetical protein [Xanthobacter agilis]|jgi:hypothetical protein|uniref:Lipoprotein n=2 Tax=Xanthobacter agilis TaxID=47492 RepID=A0ABU0L975_XANAG|nr:hypothetical protein [Xanthobacter agilis]MDQ0503674.1 hypothetical protein [Xanthobacter agilis]
MAGAAILMCGCTLPVPPIGYRPATATNPTDIELIPCAQAWEKLWPLAKQGDKEAMDSLSTALLVKDLLPPGGSPIQDSLRRKIAHGLTLQIYALDPSNPLPKWLWHELKVFVSNNESVYISVENDTIVYIPVHASGQFTTISDACKISGNACVKTIKSTHLIPDFDSYAAAVDRELTTPTTVCRREYL